MELSVYAPAAWAAVLGLAFCGFFVAMAIHVGPRRITDIKNIPFECGSDPIGDPRGRYSVKFYQVAILFLVFDIEAAFMYPWALLFKDMSFAPERFVNQVPFIEMMAFIVVLLVALAYVWRKKAIGWD